MGDATPVFNVTVGAGGAALAATSVPVAALPGALPIGSLLLFGVGKVAELTAPAASGALTITVKSLAAALVAGDIAEGGKVYATIAQYTDMTPPNPSRSTFDTTHYLSPGGYMEFGSGLVDPGTSSVTYNWLPRDPTQDGATGLLKAFADGLPRDFRIVWNQFSPPVVYQFNALVTSQPITAPINDRMTGSAELKINGAIKRY